MSENFRKIKKKYMTIAVIAGAVLGACLGVALTCTLAVIFKTCAVNFHWALYIPIALALSAGAGWLFFLILKPDDKRIAKKLDKQFALNQKVQTMVEYAGVEGDLPELQRQQTDEVLGGVAKKRVDLKWLLKFAAVPVVAASMLFAGIFVPAKKSAQVDKPYDITDAHETALLNLIADVEGSSLETGLKTFTVLELNGLLDMVKQAEYQSEMKTAVISSVHNIDALVGGANSYLKIDAVLKADEVLQPFSAAVVNGVVNYKNSASLTTMDAVKAREADAADRITAVLEGWKIKYLEDFAPKAEGAEEGTPLAPDEAAAKLKPFADALASGLADSRLEQFAPQSDAAREAAAGDSLYLRLTELSDRLTRHSDPSATGAYNAASYYTATEGYLDGFIKDGAVALSTQSYNCMMDDYIRNALSRIFGISRAEFGSNADVAPAPSEDETGGNNKQPSNGGYGDGVHISGSNDVVLDPDSGEKKEYGGYIDPERPENGTLYNKYYNRAMEYIQSGACSDEVAAYIRQYFAYLNNGMEKDKDNN